jgi:alpha-L-fucosidase
MDASARNVQSWQKDRFGMFVHWGLYSVGDLDCWVMHDLGIPVSEYAETLEPKFTAKGFDADSLAKMAKDAGCRYVVLGSRHHEGYCLWDSATTNFTSKKMTPKRDLIGEYVRAAREHGLKVGFYYSLLDWRFQSYWMGPRKDSEGWKKLVEYVHEQVRELMSNYGKIDILWYDGAWPVGTMPGWGFSPTDEEVAASWRSSELNAMVRGLQPGIIINNRSFLPEDFGTPEQTITPMDRPWELCDTMGDLWGVSSSDKNRKSVLEMLTRLITCVSKGGNMLLNVGPNADGSIQPWQKQNMERIGRWLDIHGEAIYGCGGEWRRPFSGGLAPWRATRNGDTIYLHLLRYPGSSLGIGNFHDTWIESAELLDTGARLEVAHEATRDIVSGLPTASPDDLIAVIKLHTRPATDAEIASRQMVGLGSPNSSI